MFAIRVPVYRSASLLVMGWNLLLGTFDVAEIPALDGTVVRTEGELYGVSRRPLNIADTTANTSVLVSTLAGSGLSAHISQVPKSNGGVVTCRKQQVALMRVEGEFVNLTRMLVQFDKLDAGTIQVVEDDFTISNCSRNMRAELAMRPFYILDAQAFTLSCMGIGIVKDSSSKIGLVNNLGVVHTYCFENLLASKHGMGPLTVDVQGGDVEACLVCCILRVASPDAALWAQWTKTNSEVTGEGGAGEVRLVQCRRDEANDVGGKKTANVAGGKQARQPGMLQVGDR